MEMSDGDLVDRAKGGSSEAFRELVARHQGRVRAYLSQYFSDPVAVDDLAQDVLLSAYRSLGRFDRTHAFAPWLLGIARNLSLKELRDAYRRRARERESVELALLRERLAEAEREPGGSDPEDHLAALEECMRKLPGTSATILADVYFNFKRPIQVARDLGRTESSIRMILLRLRRSLRDCIQKRLAAEGSA
jgi:RNA polymerase sigma-70 factor, ECF subfamily